MAKESLTVLSGFGSTSVRCSTVYPSCQLFISALYIYTYCSVFKRSGNRWEHHGRK